MFFLINYEIIHTLAYTFILLIQRHPPLQKRSTLPFNNP